METEQSNSENDINFRNNRIIKEDKGECGIGTTLGLNFSKDRPHMLEVYCGLRKTYEPVRCQPQFQCLYTSLDLLEILDTLVVSMGVQGVFCVNGRNFFVEWIGFLDDS